MRIAAAQLRSHKPHRPQDFNMSRNVLYALVGALVVATAVLGYKVYQDNKEPQGLQINLGPGGVKIQNK
jgi:hypothetical protein